MSISRVVRRALTGRYRWGWVHHRQSRYGRKALRVHVYDPATPGIARTCAHLFRTWLAFALPIIAVALWVGLTATTIPGPVLLLGIVALLGAAWVALACASRDARRGARRATAEWSARVSTVQDLPLGQHRVVLLWRRLHLVEELYDRGDVAGAEYSHDCAKIFAKLPEGDT